ncbi:MAG: hypothetical protein HRT73_10640, partial [Flavobacteriales bacterium]|nr:hypothetical protein [Flavobacteriales bacterium]
FLINYLSPGTLHRDEITPSLSFIDLMLYTGYGSIKFLLFSIYKTFIPALFIAVNFYLLGEKLSKPIFQNFKPLPELIKSLIIIGITIFLNQIIVIYALGGLAPDRSSITSSIIIAIILIRYLFLLGNYHQKKYTQIKYLLIINIITLIGFNLYYTDIHYNYAKSVDKRIVFIKENDTEIIWVKPLPNSGYIYSAEITEDANNFKNQHLKNGLGVKNNIVLITDH